MLFFLTLSLFYFGTRCLELSISDKKLIVPSMTSTASNQFPNQFILQYQDCIKGIHTLYQTDYHVVQCVINVSH